MMKFKKIFSYEFNYQVTTFSTWVYFAVILVLSFLMTRDGSLSEVLYADMFINSPFAIAKTAVFGSIIWLLIAPGVAGAAAARDVEMRMHPLSYTMPVSKAEYLGGRLVAALALNACILLAVPAGILLGVYLPGVHPAAIGPFNMAAYINAYSIILLVNGFVATSIQFSVAARSGRPMAAYLGTVFLVFMGFFVASLLLFKRGLGTLLDPVGIRFIVEDVAHLWTSIEQKRRLIKLEGNVLSNRLLWTGISLGGLLLTWLNFRFTHRTGNRNWWKGGFLSSKLKPDTDGSTREVAGTATGIPVITRSFGFTMHARQTIATTVYSFKTIATSRAGMALLAGVPLLTVPVVLDQMGYDGGVLLPVTFRVIKELTAPLSAELSRWVIIPAFIVFFAGELVWKERDARLGEITHAMPGSEWPPFLGKYLGLSLVMFLFLAFLTMAGIFAQVLSGYRNFETGLYLKIMFGLQLPEYLLFGLLALVVHVVADHKYSGHLVAISMYVFIAMSSLFGIEHNLLVYGSSPAWSYSEMRGFEPSIGPWLWFKSYWAAWALLLAFAGRLFWVRGVERNFRVRFRMARDRMIGFTAAGSLTAAALIIVLGIYIFYNTNVLNRYLTASRMKAQQAGYERSYGKYRQIPQPRLAVVKLNIEIYPDLREAQIKGIYSLVNRTGTPIKSIHLATVPEVETGAATTDRPATLVVADNNHGYRIYELEKWLQPGDSLKLGFAVHIRQRGFGENGINGPVVANGTHITNSCLPAIGYQSSRELTSPADRREYGLVPRPLIASLYDREARRKMDSGRTILDVVIGTGKDQVAVAPGELQRNWKEAGRNYYHYSTDAPGNEWDFFSARYAVHQASWNDPAHAQDPVAIRIFHHPAHTAHISRMVESIRASLNYYTSQFGAYHRSQVIVVERPGNGTGMHAEAGMLTHGEGFTSWMAMNENGSHDHPFAIVAHEMAHQWTVPYANVEGAPVMSESLAWYYAMKAVEKAKGKEHLQWLLSFMRQPHPIAPIRRGEPLLRGLDRYMSYRKGPFALYALSEYLGEEQVNGALRRLREKHRPANAPLATTLDLYDELQQVTPDSLKYLLHDLFEVNTFWELKAAQATAIKTSDGLWQVRLDVDARKVVVDSAGKETAVQMNDWIEIGVSAPGNREVEPGLPAYLQKHRIKSGKQTVIITVANKPTQAGIDPNFLLIDLVTADNKKAVFF